jgi:hypothetical protein
MQLLQQRQLQQVLHSKGTARPLLLPLPLVM